MIDQLEAELPEAVRLALSSARRDRGVWLAGFALDARLAGIVARANEPLLAQMRLAWWRDQLAKPAGERQRGDAVLDLAGECWSGREAALRHLVDGWEALLAEPPLAEDSARQFAAGRAKMIGAIEAVVASGPGQAERAGRIWALADLAARSGEPEERDLAIDLARRESTGDLRLPPSMRPLAVLLGLAKRSIARGGTPLIGDRWSPLVAARLGLFGR